MKTFAQYFSEVKTTVEAAVTDFELDAKSVSAKLVEDLKGIYSKVSAALSNSETGIKDDEKELLVKFQTFIKDIASYFSGKANETPEPVATPSAPAEPEAQAGHIINDLDAGKMPPVTLETNTPPPLKPSVTPLPEETKTETTSKEPPVDAVDANDADETEIV